MASMLDIARLPQRLVLTGVSWDYYEDMLKAIGDGHIRVTYLDGDMEIISPRDNPFPVDYLAFDGVSWAFYQSTLKQIGDRPLRVTFFDGRMEIMSPLPKHEKAKKAIARLIEAMSEELEIPIAPFGSTTFQRENQLSGLEPDECYYIQNEARVRDMDRFDPAVYPPPDLAVEVDVVNRSVAREPIYARLGVPEIWRHHRSGLVVRVLTGAGAYADHATSLAFPLLPMDQFTAFVERMLAGKQNDTLRDFRRWVRELPR